jgi:hypothetical protein
MTATYLDREQATPVSDIYDFGGGLYFTHLIGRHGGSLHISKDTGWLVGEGVVENDRLKGRIEFHPYGEGMGQKPPQPIIRDWEAHLVESSGSATEKNALQPDARDGVPLARDP